MAKEDKKNQPVVQETSTERVATKQTENGKKKYKAIGTNGSIVLTCTINDKETQIVDGEVIELTELEKNKLNASCTWKFEVEK